MTNDELKEKVALVLYNQYRKRCRMPPVDYIGANHTDAANECRDDASAAIDIVLEEAARVAEAFPACTHGNLATAPYAAAEQASDEIAAAIRAMKKD